MKRHASMNRIYRLVWSHVLNAWVAVAETVRGRGKQTGRKLAAVALTLCTGQALAAPIGGQVTAGSGSISQSGATTTINQSSQNLSLSWQGFNTSANETVNFVQPSASAIAVNRIYDTNGTQFLGHLNANGQVWLINPNGILFGQGSQVNVGGLVASTLDVNDADLNSASRSFAGRGTGSVANDGTINGSYVAFIGNSVSNRGTITADGGTVALGAGSAVTLTFAGDSLVHLQVEQNTLDNLAENGGLIRADGGRVLLTAGAKNALLASVVNNTGIIEARSVQNVNGSIVLDGGNLGTVSNSGTLDASGKNAGETGGTVKILGGQADLLAGSNIDVSGDMGGGTALVGGNYQGKGPEQNAATATVATGTTISADAIMHGDGGKVVVWSDNHTTVDGSISARGGANGGNGGQVETSGKKLDIGNNTGVATLAPMGSSGNWLLDPMDFVIYDVADAGSSGNMDVFLLNNALANGSVAIQTGAAMTCTGIPCFGTAGNGDITVAATWGMGVNWTTANTLTLSAYRNVNINGVLDAGGGTGSIVLRADNTGTGIGTVNIAQGINAGGSSYIATGGYGTTTIYTNTPTSTTGYAADGIDFYGTFLLWQLVHADSAGTVNTKTYDGTTSATLGTAFGLAGSPAGATLTAGTASFADKNAGTGKTVNFSGYSAGGWTTMSVGINAGYFLSRQPTATGEITPKTLTVSGITAGNKVYDATTAATVSTAGAVFTGKIGGDAVTVSATGTFADKNVANGKTVTLASTYGGADVGNYTFTEQASTTANITPAALSVSGITAANKVYDATTAATVSTAGAVFTGKIGADVVTVSATGTFADKNVANGKTVTLASTYGGDAGNYTITGQTSTTANITAKAVTVSGISASNKTYDGSTGATVSTAGAVFTGMVGGDALTVSATGTFADKNAANGKTVTLSSTYGGADLGNYTLTDQASTTANITPKTVTVSGITASNKTYDATTAATINTAGAVFTGKIGADVVTVSATGSFADKNVANGKTVTLASTYGGADAGNYTITDQTSATANITSANLTVTGITANNKTYDTTVGATLAGTVTVAALGADAVTVGGTGSGAFADKNVGNGKVVTITGYTLVGADAGNYTILQPTGVTANITPAALTLSGITASNKIYDGTTAATLNTAGVAFTGLLGADVVTLGGAGVGSFADKNAGNGKAVTVSGYTLGGADAGNYSVAQPVGLTADITPAALTVSGITASNKTYDATTAATVNTAGALFTGKIGADAVTVSATGTFADKNVANGKTVTLASTYGGADAGNYTFTDQASTTANIAPKAVTVSGITASNKIYDGSTTATVSTAGAVFTGMVGGDDLAVSATGTFADKNAANGKTVTLSSTYGGADLGNYTLADQAGATANITPKALSLGGITASNKTYDGTTSATLNTAGVTFTGLLGADVVTLGGAGVGSFADKNAGNGKAVTVSGYTLGGADASNYSVGQPVGLTADVIKASISVSGITASNKIYDGTAAATINTAGATFSGLIGSDAVSINSVSGSFADKNAGTGKTVTLSATYTGADAGNYTVAQPAGLAADITPAAITVSGLTANNKIYDATTAATINTAGAVLAGKIGADAVTVSASGSFADKNVGNGKSVTLASSYAGADAGNYTFTGQASASANITPKALTVSGITAANKVYDATTAATLSGTAIVTALGADVVTVGGAGSGSFADKNVGNGKTVIVIGYTLGGADAGNYTIANQASTTANITPKALTVSGITAANKVYDASTAATINTASAVFTGKIGGDAVTVSATGSFADKNVGNGKAVTLASSYSGADAGNYTITGQASTTADITPAAITVSGITAANKTYDTTTAATVNTAGAVLTGLIGGDAVAVNSVSGSFADKNAGTGKTVALSATYTGADTGNYIITGQASTTADITPAMLTVIANSDSRRYDGSAYLGGNGVTYTGFAGADNAAGILSGTLSYGGSSQGATAIGSYAITPGGLAGNANYVLSYVDGALTISPSAPPQSAQSAQNVIAQMQTGMLPPEAAANQQATGLLPVVAVQEKSGDGSSTLSIGERGPMLQILSGGVRLPQNIASNGVFPQVVDGGVRLPQDAVSLNGMKGPQL